jgi:predicted extracellular nuclease
MQNKIKSIVLLMILVALLVSGCGGSKETTTQPTVVPLVPLDFSHHLVISEVLTGIEGNNNHDFIELFNPTDTPIDLDGFTLVYQLADDNQAETIFHWRGRAIIPPLGHYLLGYTGENFGLLSDAILEQPLIPNKGGLQLLDPEDSVVDNLSWGNGPSVFTEGAAAPAMKKNVSLERLPGNVSGNGVDTDNNAIDFSLVSEPNPQNTGSTPSPAADFGLVVEVDAPTSVNPGETFTYTLTVENQTPENLTDLSLSFPIPNVLAEPELPTGATRDGDLIFFAIPELAANESALYEVTFTAPWTYTTITAHSYGISGSETRLAVSGGPFATAVEGGSVPIATAREIFGEEVIIEGIASMYTDGFYAGSSGTKFYIQDETGGVQVYVSGGKGQVSVPLGSQVRVRGRMELYRGAIELLPSSIDAVEVIAKNVDTVSPLEVSVGEAARDLENLPGLLVAIEGTVARVEEFSYSYEMDITDDSGQMANLYIDKLTEINVETITSGEQYRVVGVIEVRDANQQLNPRIQDDLQKIYPPVLVIEVDAPNNLEPETEFEVMYTVFNHTPDPFTNVVIQAEVPFDAVEVLDISDDGFITNQIIEWQIPELEGNGASASVSFTGKTLLSSGSFAIENFSATADQWQDPAINAGRHVFIGSAVPVWAIQSVNDRSPYILEYLQTSGVVTGVFPELGGFWLQETQTDNDPLTSAGLFISTPEFEPEVQSGDLVEVTGVVREIYQQTALEVSAKNNINVLQSNQLLPAPVVLDPPLDDLESTQYYEALEGMLVSVNSPGTVVAPMSAYGEFVFVLDKHNTNRLWQNQPSGVAIMVDDGTNIRHDDQSTMAYTANSGDKVSNVTGPLAYTYGNYKIEPLIPPAITNQAVSLPVLETADDNAYSIMTWNVENLFDFLDPHPSSPAMPSLYQYKRDIEKVANTIINAGTPTIVGLQEVENIKVLEDISEHETLAAYNYQPILIEGFDSRGIDVGYLVRGDQAEIVDVQQLNAPEGITSRPPLLLQVVITKGDLSETVYVLNNHFTSMSGGEAATEPRRNAQAAWNAALVQDITAEDTQANVAVIGDLNSYFDALPIETLRAGGLEHVFDTLPEAERYTYIYQGRSQTLDHILITPALMESLIEVHVLHTNADFSLAAEEDVSAQHKSDHDPVIAIFTLE